MADVSISYKGNTIADMSASGTKTLLTADSYCENNIVVEYTKPTASDLVSGTKSITENGTGIDVTNYASVDVNVSGGGGFLVTITRNSGRTGAMDKTWGEIKAALDAGIAPVIYDVINGSQAYTTNIYVSVDTKSIAINQTQNEPFKWTTDDSYPTYSGSGGGSND